MRIVNLNPDSDIGATSWFVDIEGHRDDANVASALAEVEKIAGYLKVLGSYPAAVL